MSIYNIIGKKIRPIELALLIKRLFFIKRRERVINGYKWYLDPISDFGLRLINERSYETEMTDLILSQLSENDIFIDLGANEGYFSILASKKVGEKGKVYSIEPQQRLWNVILNNIQFNRCKNISLLPFAVSDSLSSIQITLSPDINTGSSTLAADARKIFWKKQLINTETLDSIFFGKVDTIKLIKIDIEGFELFALKGAALLLRNKIIQNLIIELHPTQLALLNQSVEQLNGYLYELGYQNFNGVYSYKTA